MTGVRARASRTGVGQNGGNRVAGGTGGQSALPPVPVVVLDGADPGKALAALREGAVAMAQAGSRTMVVDVSRLPTLSSPMLSALLWTQRRCRDGGAVVMLRGLSRRNRRALQETGLWRSLEIEADGQGADQSGPRRGPRPGPGSGPGSGTRRGRAPR